MGHPAMENDMNNSTDTWSEESANPRRFFSRDINYLRDAALFWPFVVNVIFAVGYAFNPMDRALALRCAVVVIAALLLAKEKLFLILVGLGFIAIRCVITLIFYPWNWLFFIGAILAGVPFLAANHYWRNPKLAYSLPEEFRLIDALLAIASIIGTIFLAYMISPS
jgi:hypothetical protein